MSALHERGDSGMPSAFSAETRYAQNTSLPPGNAEEQWQENVIAGVMPLPISAEGLPADPDLCQLSKALGEILVRQCVSLEESILSFLSSPKARELISQLV